MITPYEQARHVYKLEPCIRSFEEDLEAHFLNGFVVNTPDYFIMGRPVPSNAIRSQIVDPWYRWTRDQCDCWHIYLAAGDMRQFWDQCPKDLLDLPYASFERKNVLHIWPMKRIRMLICKC